MLLLTTVTESYLQGHESAHCALTASVFRVMILKTNQTNSASTVQPIEWTYRWTTWDLPKKEAKTFPLPPGEGLQYTVGHKLLPLNDIRENLDWTKLSSYIYKRWTIIIYYTAEPCMRLYILITVQTQTSPAQDGGALTTHFKSICPFCYLTAYQLWFGATT